MKIRLILSLLLLITSPLYAEGDIPEKIVKAYWKNCALYLQKLAENPPPQDEVDIIITRMVEIRETLNSINWLAVKEPEQFLALLQNGD